MYGCMHCGFRTSGWTVLDHRRSFPQYWEMEISLAVRVTTARTVEEMHTVVRSRPPIA